MATGITNGQGFMHQLIKFLALQVSLYLQYNLSFCECIFRLGNEETELTPGLKNEIYQEQSEDTVAYNY